MRLVVAVVHAQDAAPCVSALNDAGFVCTRLDSFGGFLDRDNATLLIGVEAARVDEVVGLLRSRAQRRNERLGAVEAPANAPRAAPPAVTHPVDVEVGGATVFVLTVDRFEKL